jgi:hypothetical protein
MILMPRRASKRKLKEVKAKIYRKRQENELNRKDFKFTIAANLITGTKNQIKKMVGNLNAISRREDGMLYT